MDGAGGHLSATAWPADGSALTLRSVVERATDPGCRSGWATQMEGARVRLQLWGPLPFDWSGNLSLHGHAAGLSVVDLDARHLGGARWAGSALLEALSTETDIRSLDLLAMARHRPAWIPANPPQRLEVFETLPAASDGALRVFVGAPDRLGLLARIVEAVLSCGLRPRELCVRTRDGRAGDWLTLEARAGGEPDPDAVRRLRASLDAP